MCFLFFPIEYGSSAISGQMHDWRHHYKVFPSYVSTNENACFGRSIVFHNQEIQDGGQKESWILSNAMNASLQEVRIYLEPS